MSAAAAAAVADAARSGQKRKTAAAYDDGAGNESDADDADFMPSPSRSSASASGSRSRSISPATLADSKSEPGPAPKRAKRPPRRAAAAAAAAANAAEAAGEEAAAAPRGGGGGARESRKDRDEEEDPEMEAIRKQREIMRVGQVFLADLPPEKHSWFSWLWDVERDPATAAARDGATVITKDTLGMKMTTPIDDFRRAWTRHLEDVDRNSFSGGQSDGGYCWACEVRDSVEYRDQPNEHLDRINHMIVEGRTQDPHFVAQQIMTYYVFFIAQNTSKIWSLVGIYDHIVKHLKDDVYLINALVINNMNKLDKLEERGVLRDKTSVDCYVKLSNLQLKLLTAKRHVQRETNARTRS